MKKHSTQHCCPDIFASHKIHFCQPSKFDSVPQHTELLLPRQLLQLQKNQHLFLMFHKPFLYHDHMHQPRPWHTLYCHNFSLCIDSCCKALQYLFLSYYEIIQIKNFWLKKKTRFLVF